MIDIAYRFIRYDIAKSIGALSGVIVSMFLIGQQCGIFIFLSDAMSALVRFSDADLWIVDDKTEDVNALGPIDTRIEFEAASFPGVNRADPVLITASQARFRSGVSAPVALIGSLPPRFAGGPWNVVAGSKADLLLEGAVTVDVFDKRLLSDISMGGRFEIAGKQAVVVAMTKGVRGFGPAYMFCTLDQAREFSNESPYRINAVLVHADSGINIDSLSVKIQHALPEVRVWLTNNFARSSVAKILSSSGIAFSFGSLIIFAIISGLVIIGLTLYSAVLDRMRDYGTMKAIGADNKFLSRLIYTQALIFCSTGFIVVVIMIELFRIGMARVGTIFHFPWWLWLVLLLIDALICLGGALFAVRRILKLEPASVFRT
jgi:putative ABC transport system permease protein